jgi:hypothetical protein
MANLYAAYENICISLHESEPPAHYSEYTKSTESVITLLQINEGKYVTSVLGIAGSVQDIKYLM